MEEKPEVSANVEVMRELKNDFTFFIAMAVLKSMASSTPDPKVFIKDIIWKWRELKVNSLGIALSESEKIMFSCPELKDIFGEFMKDFNKVQRETLILSIRTFCEDLEKILINNLENKEDFKE